MNDVAQAYFEGIITKCAEYGIDAEQLVKNAQLGALAPAVAKNGISSLGRAVRAAGRRARPKLQVKAPAAAGRPDPVAMARLQRSAGGPQPTATEALAKLQEQQIAQRAQEGVAAGNARFAKPTGTVATNPKEQQILDQAHLGETRPAAGGPVNSGSLQRVAQMHAAGLEPNSAEIKPTEVGISEQARLATFKNRTQAAPAAGNTTEVAPTGRLGNWMGLAAVPAGAYALAKGEQFANENPTMQSGMREVGEYANDIGNAYNGAPLGTR